MLSTASSPSRHSPTTSISGSCSSNSRILERARGSSSTINAVIFSILACTKWDENCYLHALLFFVRRYLEKMAVTVECFQSAPGILEPDALVRRDLACHAVKPQSVVEDLQSKLVADLGRRDPDHAVTPPL